MATNKTRYISYSEAVFLHIDLMCTLDETRFGIAFPALIYSALARLEQAAVYENADLNRQAATLCFGLIKNHPWAGGNKHTATHITETFLMANGWELTASIEDIIKLVLDIEADRHSVDDIEEWYSLRTSPTR